MKGRGVDATLAAMATLTAAWPVSTLLVEPTWLGGAVLMLAVIAVSGVGARSLALRGWQVLMSQLVCALLAASWIYGRGHLWHGLPYIETLRFAGRRSQEALTAVHTYAAPAPSTPGLIFVVGCGLGLVALAVDYLAVTRSSPSLQLGVSPRGATALLSTAKAWAWLSGRDYLTPDDVKALARPTLRHRISLRAEAELEGASADGVLEGVLATVPVPR